MPNHHQQQQQQQQQLQLLQRQYNSPVFRTAGGAQLGGGAKSTTSGHFPGGASASGPNRPAAQRSGAFGGGNPLDVGASPSLTSANQVMPAGLPGFDNGREVGRSLHNRQGQSWRGMGSSEGGDFDGGKALSTDEALHVTDIPWLLQLRRFGVLSVHDAEHLLLMCVRDLGNIINDLFDAEGQSITNPAKQAMYDALKDSLTLLLEVLSKLPPSSFVNGKGQPDAQFHNVVQGLCHLWGSSDTRQLSNVMRHISLSRPAEAAAQFAVEGRVRLPVREHIARDRFWSIAHSKIFFVAMTGLMLFIVGQLFVLSNQFDILSGTASLFVWGILSVIGVALGVFSFGVTYGNRTADEMMLRAMAQSTDAGLLACSTAGVSENRRQTTLAGAMAAQNGGGGQHQGGGGGGNLIDALRMRYPHGFLMVPADTPDGWACIDARPVNKHAVLVGVDLDRHINLWNTAAADATGYTEAAAMTRLAKEHLTAPGDTLFRLPRMVGEHAEMRLHNIVSGDIGVDVVIGDMRDVHGEPLGHCFVTAALREDYTSTRSYLHEYLRLELWEGLSNLETLAAQLLEVSKGVNSLPTPTRTVNSSPEVRSNGRDAISSAHTLQSEYTAGGEMPRSDMRNDSALGRNSGDGSSHGTSYDLKLLHTSLLREGAKMRVTVRQLGWDSLNLMARNIATQWEWTNGERVLGAAARHHLSKASVRVDPSAPTSFRLAPTAARMIKTIIHLAPARCDVFVQHSKRSARVGRISVTVMLSYEPESPAESGRADSGNGRPTLDHLRRRSNSVKFGNDALLRELGNELFDSCATLHVHSDDTAVSLHFPCIRDVEPEGGAKRRSVIENVQLPAQVVTVCPCAVAVCLENPVDQHNLAMMLIGVAGVSLSSCRDVADLQTRLKTTDIVIVANSMRAEVELDDDLDAVVIPVVEEDAPFQQDTSFIRLPLKREDVHALVVQASECVAELKEQARAAREREEILRARHDAPWSKGKLLGRGTFGVCYEATNDYTGGKMAVKHFEHPAKQDGETDKFVTSLVNEIKILTKLEHPNIVHYFHTERNETGVYLFMELCDGSLHDIIKNRRGYPPELYQRAVPVIMHQVLQAVAYLHNLNIIHRDLKPQNILTKGNLVKLTDFGTAHQISKDETLRDVQGTLRFMAPEVYRAEAYNRSCDTWSIGCVLCELLDVKVPFMSQGQHDLLGELRQEDVVLSNAAHISDDAKDFILLCLQVHKDLRPAVSTLLMHPFVQSMDSQFRLTMLTRGTATETPANALLPMHSNNYNQLPQQRGGQQQGGDDSMAIMPRAALPVEQQPTMAQLMESGDGFSLNSNA